MFGFLVLALLVAAMTNERTQLNLDDTYDSGVTKTELLSAKAQNEE